MMIVCACAMSASITDMEDGESLICKLNFAVCSDKKFNSVFGCRLEKSIKTLFSGLIRALSMMSPNVHAGSDKAYARVLVAKQS
jgi:hypothetical protein